MNLANLEQIVSELSSPRGSDMAVSDQVMGLKSRYDEPWRYYHTFEHPREMFGVLLEHRDLVRNIGAVGWAIMYHDAVYDPQSTVRGRNEELSAQLAEFELPRVAAESIPEKVAHYTRQTIEHKTDEDDPDLDFFLDIDLTILGADTERYDRYMNDVREEYGHVDDVTYSLARIGVLEGLARRAENGRLYTIQAFADKYEERAQENIAREIDALRRMTREV